MAKNVDLIRGGYEAFARQDIPAVLALFDQNIEWRTPDTLPEGGTVRGPQGVARFFQSLPKLYAELRVQPDEFLDAGDRVVVLGHHRGRAARGAFEVGFAHAWTLRDGKVTRFVEYTDTAAIAKVIG
jgi:ketosteroid isomerase-like protein